MNTKRWTLGMMMIVGALAGLSGCVDIVPPPGDPCAGVTCDDGDLCTTDECVNGECINLMIAIDCPEGSTCDPDTGTCVEEAPSEPQGFLDADGINGGKLYDKFWASETGFDQNDSNIGIFNDFFRCKQCHGWDRLSNAGAYINRAPKTTRPNVSGVNLAEHAEEESPQDLFEAIKAGHGAPRRAVDADLSTYDPNDPSTTVLGDQMPNFSQILSDEQIWDLVKYLKEEAFDTTELYEITTEGTYPDGSRTFSDWGRDGDPANGDDLFATKCAGCHGADGTGGAFEIEEGALTVGSHLRNKPYETWHKVKFGQLGSAMLAQGINSLDDMKDLYAALADSEKYPDPTE
jgi:mono/diheme cytochrome c family protein